MVRISICGAIANMDPFKKQLQWIEKRMRKDKITALACAVAKGPMAIDSRRGAISKKRNTRGNGVCARTCGSIRVFGCEDAIGRGCACASSTLGSQRLHSGGVRRCVPPQSSSGLLGGSTVLRLSFLLFG